MPPLTRIPLARPAAWSCILAAAWMTGKPALVGLAAWWCFCLHAARPAARRLGAAARSALLSFALALATLAALARSGALDGLVPEPAAGEVAAAERRAAVARSIAKALADGEAAWRAAPSSTPAATGSGGEGPARPR